jgi:hypothetical protein
MWIPQSRFEPISWWYLRSESKTISINHFLLLGWIWESKIKPQRLMADHHCVPILFYFVFHIFPHIFLWNHPGCGASASKSIPSKASWCVTCRVTHLYWVYMSISGNFGYISYLCLLHTVQSDTEYIITFVYNIHIVMLIYKFYKYTYTSDLSRGISPVQRWHLAACHR